MAREIVVYGGHGLMAPFWRIISAGVFVAAVSLSVRVSAVFARPTGASGDDGVRCRVSVTVVTPLPYANTPMDPVIRFGELIRAAKLAGTLDPNSIRVIDADDDSPVEHATTDDFADDDQGRVEWVIRDPKHTRYSIHFRVVPKRVALKPQSYVPAIGVGDLLRYNAGEPRPVVLPLSVGLVDLRGTGRLDLVGCWTYAYRPGDPWHGIVGYPRVGDDDRFEFGDLFRLRYAEKPDDRTFKHFSDVSMSAGFADFNRDGRMDLVCVRRGSRTASFFRNIGDADASGTPKFIADGSVPVSGWEACRAVDLNSDGACDLVVDGEYTKNLNPNGWPFQPDKPVALDAGREPCFVDLDGDGRLDSVCLLGKIPPRLQGEGVVPPFLDEIRVGWRRNLGGEPPKFADEKLLAGVDLTGCTSVAVGQEAGKTLLAVQHGYYQHISIFKLARGKGAELRMENQGEVGSKSAVLALGDQAWPCLCDWNGDGLVDLLVGEGYGFLRVLINEGTPQRPSFAKPALIESEGKPIRFLRNEILGDPPLWHNMGYSYPVFVRWDDDDLPDLVCPNETNRIFWFKNVGTRSKPRFGPRRQLMVEGFEESPERLATSAKRALDAVYPREKEVPFFWRTGAALADFNDDGLTDLVTLDGERRQATLFAQSRSSEGTFRLRKSGALKLSDGRPIDDSIVHRPAHWTECFRAVDWDDDGLVDLCYSLASGSTETQDGGSIYWLRNCGTRSAPRFEPPVTLRCFGDPIRITAHGPMAWPGDFDGDGKPDLVACVEWSVYLFYRHAALMMKSRPKIELGKLEILR